ncbi:MAG TPA: chemotaxis protein CheW [Polyangiales bacterium]|nr:chemotaxis protein CheW [Polyangiales bacterium]
MEASANARDRITRRGDASESAVTTSVETLLFELSGERYALPMCDVIEIVRAVAVRALPTAPAITLGIIDVRGDIVPVLDARVRFGHPHKTIELSDQFLIAHAGPRRVALHVDAALGIELLTVLAVDDAGNLPSALGHLAGVAATEEGLVLIHDLRAFLSQAEAVALDAALESTRSTAESPTE